MFVVRESRNAMPPELAELGKAEGFVHVCDQAALMFGSNRREPVAFRPVVSVRKDGARAVVLPCTTKDHSTDPDFFELVNDQHVQWTRPWDGRRSFASCRYEVVAQAHLRQKVGVMPQSVRIQLLDWLMERG